MNALDRLLAKKGKTRVDFKRGSRVGKMFRNKGVADTPELQRVLNLPEYRWQEDRELDEVAAFIKDEYGLPKRQCEESCICKGKGEMDLRPIQAAALMQVHDFGGLLAPVRVGGGKTLISFLAGTVLGAERVMLVIPAKLRKKTEREFAKLSRHWKKPARMHVMSYELLSRDRGISELQSFRPDLVVADEAHKFKSTRAACTKRMRRYLTKENTDAQYIDMSGTVLKRSIMEVYHRQNWALRDGFQPLPRKYNEARDWADAIDEKVSPAGRIMPGALYQFCTDSQLSEAAKDPRKSTQVKIVREAFKSRFMTTPGVIGTEEMFDGAMSIALSTIDKLNVGEEVHEAFEGLRERWELPDGHPIDEPAQLWMAARCLIQGFYYRWEPLPPKEWLMWRKEWGRCVRDILKNYPDIDSPMVVAREVRRGRIPWAENILREWERVKDTFKPQTKAFWIDDGAFNFCRDWAQKNRGIIWVNEVALGERLRDEGGLPYYGSKGMCGKKMIEDETGTCVASIAANSEGRNLQHFSLNLVAAPPPGGATWEQMLGRTHRDGQEADEVGVQVLLGCYENWKVLMQAIKDAEFAEATTGQYQKLNFSDVSMPDPPEVEFWHNEGSPLWSKTNADFFKSYDKWTNKEIQMSSMSMEDRAQARRDAYAGIQ